METPGSTPSAELEAASWVTGQVMPGAPAPALFEPDEPGDGNAPGMPARKAWLFVFKPKWLAWHLFVAVAFCGMLWLGYWQYHRALGGNGLSWAYTFEWPLFAGFSVVFWARTIRDEYVHRRHGGLTERQLIERAARAHALATLPPGAIVPAGSLPPGFSIRQLEQAPGSDADDPELASYNAYLRKLETRERRKALKAGAGKLNAAERRKALGAG